MPTLGGTAGSTALEPRPRPLYVGRNFAAYSPDDRYLLTMRLFAARDRDSTDAVRLSTDSGVTSAEAMFQLIDNAFTKRRWTSGGADSCWAGCIKGQAWKHLSCMSRP